jgi:2-polyprenyl-3-methyl-5-hydroxy-6-metoxy-1,4-benzoquinol methylase
MIMNEYNGYEVSQGWQAEEFSKFSLDQANYFSAEVLPLMPSPSTSTKVLDIGFGNGSFLGWAKSQGYSCTGLEVNERLVRRALDDGFPAVSDLSQIQVSKNDGFQVVTAFDVLEHIRREDLINFLTGVRSICSSDAVVILRFPNGDNPFSLCMQNGDVTHQTWIGRGMLRQVAQLAGFDVASLRGPAIVTKGFSLKRRLSVALGIPIRRAFGKLISGLFMGGAEVSLSPNLLAVLRPSQQRLP